MAMQYWNGYSWRRISDKEARFRRARGQEVVEADAKETPPKMPGPAQVNRLEDVLSKATVEVREEKTPPLPAAPLPTQPKAISFDTLTDSIQMPGVADAEMAVRLGHAADGDLTDEELERLTAPDNTGGEG